jgi:hypothetical protein
MAFAAGQIPVVIGHQGIVQHCRELGFDMFDDVINNSFDQLPNHVRAEQAIELNQDLILGKINLSPFWPRLLQQRDFLLNQYPELMRQRFVKDCAKLTAPDHG